MMMMFYHRRASPKHRYDMIEVDYGGRGHRTWLRDQEINYCVFGVPPAPVYKGARRRQPAKGRGAPKGGSPTPTGSRTPPFLVGIGEGKGEEERGKGAPPLPSPIRTSPWGGVRPPFGAFVSFPVWPSKAQYEFP